jgi:hypothetical protein
MKRNFREDRDSEPLPGRITVGQNPDTAFRWQPIKRLRPKQPGFRFPLVIPAELSHGELIGSMVVEIFEETKKKRE